MLISLFLRNFRRFEEVNVTFSPGMNGLFGDNYTGKSTLVLAIAVAIGGPGFLRGYHLARRGQEQFEIQAVLELGGQQYRVLRTKSGAKLWRIGKEDKLIATAQGQVNIELGKLLGMPVDRWLELRFVRQKQAAQMFEAGATKLNLLVEELTGVNTISNVIKQLTETQKMEAVALHALQERVGGQDLDDLAGELAELKYRREQIERAVTTFDGAHAKANEQLQAVGVKILGIETKIAGQRDLLRDARDIARDIARLERELGDLQPPARKLEVVHAEAASLGLEHTELSNWLTGLAAANKALAAANRKKNVFGDAKVLVDEVEPAKAVATLRGELDKVRADFADARSTVNNLEQQIIELDEQYEEGMCPTCSRPFEDDAEHREALKARKAELSEVAHSARKTRDAARQQLEQLESGMQEAERSLSRAISHNRGVETHNAGRQTEVDAYEAALAEVRALEQAHSESEAEIEERVKQLGQRDRQLMQEEAAIKAYGTARSKLDTQLTSAKRQQEALHAKHTLMEESDLVEHEEKLRDLTEQRVGVIAEVRQAKQSAEMARGQEKDLARDVDRAQKRIEALTAAQEDLEQRGARLANIEGLRKYLRDNRSRYLQAAWELILGRASAFASATTDGFISEIRRTEDGTFEFIEQDQVAQVNEASGAQQAVLGLGIQVALAETLPTTLDLFLADEPTADMDADHSSSTLLNLSAVSKQAIVISHHRMDESLCSEVMELVR